VARGSSGAEVDGGPTGAAAGGACVGAGGGAGSGGVVAGRAGSGAAERGGAVAAGGRPAAIVCRGRDTSRGQSAHATPRAIASPHTASSKARCAGVARGCFRYPSVVRTASARAVRSTCSGEGLARRWRFRASKSWLKESSLSRATCYVLLCYVHKCDVPCATCHVRRATCDAHRPGVTWRSWTAVKHVARRS
jgi:hypothetical protein